PESAELWRSRRGQRFESPLRAPARPNASGGRTASPSDAWRLRRPPSLLRQRGVADFFDDLLACIAHDPIDELLLRPPRLIGRIEVEEAGKWVAAVLGGRERWRNGGGGGVLLHVEGMDAFEVRDTAIANTELVALDGVHDGGGAGQGLHGRREVLVLEH